MQEKEAGGLNPGNYLLQEAVQWSLVSAPDDRSHRQHATPDPGTELQKIQRDHAHTTSAMVPRLAAAFFPLFV